MNEIRGVADRRAVLRLSGLAAAGAAGAAGSGFLVAGSASAAPVGAFNTITPYRSVDTRDFGPDGRLPSGFEEDWDLWSDSGGNGRIPSNAAAVTFNLTITQTVGSAFLAMFPAGAEYPGVSSINWSGNNVTLANGGTVALGPSEFTGPGSVTVFCGGGGSRTHYIIDVTGYFAGATVVASAPSSSKAAGTERRQL